MSAPQMCLVFLPRLHLWPSYYGLKHSNLRCPTILHFWPSQIYFGQTLPTWTFLGNGWKFWNNTAYLEANRAFVMIVWMVWVGSSLGFGDTIRVKDWKRSKPLKLSPWSRWDCPVGMNGDDRWAGEDGTQQEKGWGRLAVNQPIPIKTFKD